MQLLLQQSLTSNFARNIRSRELQHNFAAGAGTHECKSLFDPLKREYVSDTRFDACGMVQKELIHLIPSFKHTAAGDAMNGDAFEHNVLGPIDLHAAGGDAEEADFSTVTEQAKGLLHGFGVTAHFEDDLGAIAISEFGNACRDVIGRGIEDNISANGSGEGTFELVGFDDDDKGGTGLFHDAHREETDGTCAHDEDSFEGERGGHSSVHGIAERVIDRGKFIGDSIRHAPDILLGHYDELGETAVAVDAETFNGTTNVAAAGAAEFADTARDVAFGGDARTGDDGADFRTTRDNLTDELVADSEGWFDALL